MKRTVKALQDLYVKLGGSLTDTYSGIADGIKVGLYKRIPDIIEAVKEKASGGGGGSGLPEVTAADNGDVLTVVEGAWAKASPSGGDIFDIKFTSEFNWETHTGTATCNKTSAEILAEYQANGYDNMRVTLDESSYPVRISVSGEFVEGEPSDFAINAHFLNVSIADDEMYAIAVSEYYNPETHEDVVEYTWKAYTLTPSE